MPARLSRPVRIAKPRARALPDQPDRLRIRFVRGGREILVLVLDIPNTNVQTENGIRRVENVARWIGPGFDIDAGECIQYLALDGVDVRFEIVEGPGVEG